ncbi:MAG: histone deacetylase family protein, partial [Mangrovicoccus sp.]
RVVEAAPQGAGWVPLDSDTHLNKGTLNAARRGVGGNLKAVDMVLDGAVQNAFVAMRPPGHHAERDTAMGFCFFGNAAIAAKHALDRRGLSRVAIVDFDVHHGNGTQDLLWDEPRALFISTHQMPLYPGTGVPNEKGAHGQIVNVPLRTGTGTKAFQTAWNAHVQPALEAHEPELIFISAGFDAHMADPLAELHLLPDDFAWATEQICNVADRYAQGRIVSTLEGGYDLQGLADSVEAHLTVLMERGEKNE